MALGDYVYLFDPDIVSSPNIISNNHLAFVDTTSFSRETGTAASTTTPVAGKKGQKVSAGAAAENTVSFDLVHQAGRAAKELWQERKDANKLLGAFMVADGGEVVYAPIEIDSGDPGFTTDADGKVTLTGGAANWNLFPGDYIVVLTSGSGNSGKELGTTGVTAHEIVSCVDTSSGEDVYCSTESLSQAANGSHLAVIRPKEEIALRFTPTSDVSATFPAEGENTATASGTEEPGTYTETLKYP